MFQSIIQFIKVGQFYLVEIRTSELQRFQIPLSNDHNKLRKLLKPLEESNSRTTTRQVPALNCPNDQSNR